MISTAPTLTAQGKSLLLRAISGETITFTRFRLGEGELPDGTVAEALTALIAPVLECAIDSIGREDAGCVTITGTFDNAEVTSDFCWRELGLFAMGSAEEIFAGDGATAAFVLEDMPETVSHATVDGVTALITSYDAATGTLTLAEAPADGAAVRVYYPDGEEKLYAYANDGANGGMIRATDANVAVEQTISLIVAVGDAEHVTAMVTPNAKYPSKAEFDAHVEDQQNPHRVTKAQVGLGDVGNYAPNDLPPTYSIPLNMAALISGEKLSLAMGKIARAVKNLIDHLSNFSNPHKITAEKISAAKKAHKHDAADVETGVLPVERGGTGVADLTELASILGGGDGSPGFAAGDYVGDGTVDRMISVGFQPRVTVLCDEYGRMCCMNGADAGVYGGIAVWNSSPIHGLDDKSSWIGEWNDDGTALMNRAGGFRVNYNASARIYTNAPYLSYRYICFRGY